MIWLAWTAFGVALAIVAAVVIMVRIEADDDFGFEIDEELLEDDLRRELSDISFGGRS